MSLTVWQLDPAQLTVYYNVATCEALAQAGCKVRYITSRFLYDKTLPLSSDFQTDHIYFRGLDHPRLLEYPRLRRILRGLSYPLGHRRVLNEAKKQKPDVVHIQWSRLPRFDLWLIHQLKAAGIPVVHTVHDVVPLFALESKTDPLQAVYAAADRLIVHTQANVADFLNVYPAIPAEKMRVIPHLEIASGGIPSGATKQSAREKLGLPNDAPIFLFFGSIRYYKGMDVLIEAFQQAVAAQPDLRLVIAGKADPLEQDKIPSLADLQAHPNITLNEGFIPHDDLWAYYLAADAIVYPYRHIYQSGALITGMGFGRAVIVTDVGGMPETVDGNGWIVPPEDPTALANVMIEAANDREKLDAMGRRSRQLIDERHNAGVVAQRLIEVYNELQITK